MISEEHKKLLSNVARIQSDEVLFRECLRKQLPVVQAIAEKLNAENIPWRLITKDVAPYTRLRVDVRPQSTDAYFMLGAILTVTISKLAPYFHYDSRVAPEWTIETADEERAYHSLLTRRIQIINDISALLRNAGYIHYPFTYHSDRAWLKTELNALYPALARSFNGNPNEFRLLFGDPLNHCNLNDADDWDLRKASDDPDDPENIWWDEPGEHFDEVVEVST
jgi:hypothetical protein